MNQHGRKLVVCLLVGVVLLGGCGYSAELVGLGLNWILPEPTTTLVFKDPETGEPLSGYAFMSLHTYRDAFERNPQFTRRVEKIGSDGTLVIPSEKFKKVHGEAFTSGHEKVGFSHVWDNTDDGWKCERTVWYQLDDHDRYDARPCKKKFVLTPRDVTGDSEAWYEMMRHFWHKTGGSSPELKQSRHMAVEEAKNFWNQYPKYDPVLMKDDILKK